MISAKDDEPEWVRAYYRKAVQGSLLGITIGVATIFIGAFFFTGLRGAFYLIGMVPFVIFVLWIQRAYPPVRAWKEAWLKEHQIRTKEDSQNP